MYFCTSKKSTLISRQVLLKKTIKILAALSLGACIIWLSTRGLSATDKSEIAESFSQANYWWLVLSIIVAFISNISRTLRWQMLIKAMGYSTRFMNVMLSILVAYFANLGLPRLGEVVRCGLLKSYDDVPFEKSFGTVVTERIIDLVVFILLFIANFFIQFNTLHTYVEEEIFSQLSFNLSQGLFILAGVGLVFAAILFFMRKRLKKLAIYQKVKTMLLGFWDGIKSITKVKRPGLFIFHSLFIWFCYWLMSYLTFQSLSATAGLSPLVSFSALTIGTIGMILVQGGLGLYPLLVAGVLVIYNIAYPTAYAMGWLLWGGQTLGIIIAGVVSLVLIPVLNKKVTKVVTPE